MRARDGRLLRAWLADPRVAHVDPPAIARLRERLEGDTLLVDVEPHGTTVVREPGVATASWRRVLELDRHGNVLATLRWDDDGRLGHAWIRVAEDSWVMIEPRAMHEPSWGPCDRLWHAAHPSAARLPLTLFEAVAYEAVDRIPVLLEPARLPAGAGTATLNLIAALAADARRSRLPYHGPYATEQLFLALLESFRYCATEPSPTPMTNPLASFMAGSLEWLPAPHERVCPAPGVTVALRERLETVAWRGRIYHRPDGQGIRRHAPRRVRDADGAVLCSLWALGEPIEDHLRLDPDATTVEVIGAPSRDAEPSRLPPAVMAGVASAAAALAAVPLAPFIREFGADCELAWAPVDRDLVAVDGSRLRVSYLLRDAFVRRLHGAPTRAERLALGLRLVTELAHLFGDLLRARAQTRLAASPPEVQIHLLSEREPTGGVDDARRITGAVEALLADVGQASEGTVVTT